jgi:predicted nucleotidyltransferase
MRVAIEDVLIALNESDVRYLVVGGVAVVLHGYLRTTADLDLVVQLERENVERALQALESIGFRPRLPVEASEFADPEVRERWIEEKGMMVFSLYRESDPLLGVDLFVREPFDFDAVSTRALRVPLDRTTARIISLDDLIAMKNVAARPRDLEDVQALRALRSKEEPTDG